MVAPAPCNVASSDSMANVLLQMGASCFAVREGNDAQLQPSAPTVGGLGQQGCVLVIDDDRLVGIVTLWDLVRLSALRQDWQQVAIADIMTSPVQTCPVAALVDVTVPLALFERYQRHHLPLVDDQGQVVGLLTPESLGVALPASDLARTLTLADGSLEAIPQAPPTATLAALVQVMLAENVRAVAIAPEGEEPLGDTRGNPPAPNSHLQRPTVGVVTEWEIVQALAKGAHLATVSAQAVMTTPPLVAPNISLREAQELMQTERVSSLLVTQDGGSGVGVVTQMSLLRSLHPSVLATRQAAIRQQLQAETLVRQRVEAELEEQQALLRAGVDITLHREAQTVLRQYERVVSATTDGIALLDRHYVYRLVNQVYLDWHEKQREEIVGYSVAELLGESVFEELVKPRLDRCLAGAVDQYEAWFEYRHGGQRFVRVTYAPYMESDRTIAGVVVTTHDMTALKQAEEALQEREQFLRSIYEGVDQCIFTVDVLENEDFRFFSFNPAAERLTGQTTEAMRGKPPGEQVRQRYRECVEAGVPMTYEECLIFHDQPQWWLTTLNPLRDAESRIYRLVGTSTNITQGKQAEHRLEMQRSILERIARAEPLPDILDALLRAMEVELGDALCSIMLCDRNGIFHSGPAPHLPEAFRQAADGIPVGEGVGSCGTAVFRQQPVIVSDIATDPLWQNYRDVAQTYGLKACWSVPIVAVDGQVLGTFGVYYRDCRSPQPYELERITQAAHVAGIAIEREQALQALEDLNQALEIRVAERTADLQTANCQLGHLGDRLSLAVNSASLGIWEWDVVNNVKIWDERMYELYGIRVDRIDNLHQAWMNSLYPDDRAATEAALQKALRGEGGYEPEFRVIHPDGSMRYLKAYGRVQRDTQGNPVRMIGVNFDITEQKQMEIALRTSEERWQLALKGSNDGIWDWDIKNQRVFYSSRWKAMRGYGENEMSDRSEEWSSGIHPDDYDRVMAATQAHLRGETEFYAMEYRVRHKDGSYFWIFDRGQAFRDASGQAVRMSGSHTDITDRKQTEMALQASEERYRQIVETQMEFVIRSTPDTTITFANAALCRALGRSLDDMIGLAWDEFVPIAYLPSLQAKIAALTPENPTFESINPDYRPNDQLGWTQWISLGLFNDQGELIEIQSVGRDVTQLRQTEDALRQSEERFRGAFANTAIGMSLVSPEGRFLKTNAALCHFLGYSEAELLDCAFQDVSHPDDLAADLALARQTLEGAIDHYHLEKRFVTKQGEVVWGCLSVSLVRDSQGQPLYYVSQMQDINDRKQAEIQLQYLSERLELALKGAQIGIWEWDVATNRLIWDDRMLALYGICREDFNGHYQDWAQRVHPEDLEAENEAERKAMAGEQSGDTEFRVVHPDGTIRHLIASSFIQRNERGEPKRVAGINIDVTDRKLALQENQRLKERLQFVLSTSPAVLFTCKAGEDYGATFISDNVYAVTGFTPADFLEDSGFWATHLHPEDAPRIFADIPRLLERNHHIHEYRFQHQAGHYLWIRAELRLVRDALGTPMEVVGYFADISDRKQAEAELQISRDLHKAIYNESTDALFLVDPQTLRTLDCNQRAVELFEVDDIAELIDIEGRFLQRHPFSDEELLEIAADMERQGFWSRELEYVTRRGRIFWGNIAAKPITVAGRTMNLVRVTDISDRKQAEIALQTSETRFRRVFESSVVGMLFANFSGQIVDANDRFLEIIGYSRADLEAGLVRWDTMTPPEYAAIDQDLIVQLRQYGKVSQREKEYYRKDGSRVPVLIGVAILPGTTDQTVCVVLDMSDRKRLEQEQQRLVAILQASTDYIGMSDAVSGYVIWNNTAVKQLCGITSDAAVTQRTPQDYHPDWAIARLQQEGLPEAIAHGSWIGETALIDAQGQEIPVSQLLLAHKSPQGEVEYFSSIMRDMRVHKAYQQQLERTNAELRRATRLKDEFLANMSHELRTPLNAILGMSEGLQDEVLGEINEQQRKAIATIETSGQHLLELINDILDLSKVSAGRLELSLSSVSMAHLCTSSLVFVKQQALRKRIHLDAVIPSNLYNVEVDERRMRQALVNLLTNAVKFTPEEGQVTLEVTVQPSAAIPPPISPVPADAGSWLLCSITDTGIGIAPDDQARLFQPFVQVDSKLNRQYEGTGLGLALVKQIVELHGGFVSLFSEQGQGSCFTIGLPYPLPFMERLSEPLSPSSEPLLPVSHPPHATNAPEASPPRSSLILLAEDNQDNIDTLSSYLEVYGYRLVLARNGQEAIELAQTHYPELILMDIQMPGMDGLEAIRQIRLNSQLAQVPIIAVTALAMVGDRERCLEAGANLYLTKPLKLKQLVTTIQQLL